MDMNLVATIATFLFALIGAYVCWRYWKLNRAYANFPSVRHEFRYLYLFVTGRYRKDVPFTTIMYQDIMEAASRFEKEGFFVQWFFFPILFVFNDELLKRLYTEPATANKSNMYNLIKDFLGNGLITSEHEVWKVHRKFLNPAFHVGTLKGRMHIFNKNAANLVTKLGSVVGQSQFDLCGNIKQCTFSVMAEAILGLEIEDAKYGKELREYFDAVNGITHMWIYKTKRPWLYWNSFLPLFASGRLYLKYSNYLQSFTKQIISEMKSSMVGSREEPEDPDSEVVNKKSFARILLEQHLKDPTFTVRDVQDHIGTIMAAGHDTTTYLMLWSLYALGLHPDVQEKAFIETQALNGGDVTYEELGAMKYLECVIKETLRLYTPLPTYGRKLNKDIQWEKHTIPKGSEIFFLVSKLHKSPHLYPDPHIFNPDRFSENSEIRPWTFLPFAEGYRSCIGKRFAMMQAKVLLSHIIRSFRIETLEEIDFISDVDWSIILKPIKPLRLVFTLR